MLLLQPPFSCLCLSFHLRQMVILEDQQQNEDSAKTLVAVSFQ